MGSLINFSKYAALPLVVVKKQAKIKNTLLFSFYFNIIIQHTHINFQIFLQDPLLQLLMCHA
jgi:hypothetical protein